MGHAFGSVSAGIDNYIENIVRFATVGTHTWTVPATVKSVDVFLVGGGGSGSTGVNFHKAGGAGGYTKAFRGTGYIKPPGTATWETLPDGGRDGNAVVVTPGEIIQIIVGDGGVNSNGGYSQFKNASCRAEGGGKGAPRINSNYHSGGDGGSGGGGGNNLAGSDGSNGASPNMGYGQGHTTRDFGESAGKRNAGGGSGEYTQPSGAGISDYTEGSGSSPKGYGGGGYGGGAGAGTNTDGGKGGSGCVLIRYYTHK